MKITQAFILLGMIMLIMSCADKKEGELKPTLISNFVTVSDNEYKGVNEILEYYGGYCEYSVGASASTEEGKKKYFELKMSKSDALEQFADKAEMPASNIAFLFYKNLIEEKDNYNEIHTVILFNDNEEMTFIFPTEQLKLVEERISTIETLVDKIKNKKFDQIAELINDQSVFKYDKLELIKSLEEVNPNFGEVEEFWPLGFKFYTSDEGYEILRIVGMVKRSIQDHKFSADFDLEASKDELLYLDYSF